MCRLRPGLYPGPHWGTHSAPPNPEAMANTDWPNVSHDPNGSRYRVSIVQYLGDERMDNHILIVL